MILCVTPNVAVDRTLVVPDFGRGGVFRPQKTLITAGGKGINVARAVRIMGGEPICAGFTAGHSGALVADMIAQEGLSAHWTHIDTGETRTCVILVAPDTLQTSVINEAGPVTTPAHWQQFRQDILKASEPLNTVCFCGSLPPESDLTAFGELLADLIDAGKSVWVDSSGDALKTAAQVPGVAIKINQGEAMQLAEQDLTSTAALYESITAIQQMVSAPVVVTLGARGAIMFKDKQQWFARPPMIEAASAVGSGDAFLGGLLMGIEAGRDDAQCLQMAVAAGAANAMTIGAGHFERALFDDMLQKTHVELV